MTMQHWNGVGGEVSVGELDSTAQALLGAKVTFTSVANEAAMLALSTAVPGDLVWRVDESAFRRLIAAAYGTATNWERVATDPRYVVQVITGSPSAFTVNFASNPGGMVQVTLTENATITVVPPTVTTGRYTTCLLKIINGNGGGWAVTWAGTIKWYLGSTPVVSTGSNDVSFVRILWDGTTMYGNLLRHPA
jgi:hypothetical protein